MPNPNPGHDPLHRETVVALATADGQAGLAVIRISGPAAVAVAGRVFRGEGFGDSPESHRAVFGRLIDPDSGMTIDRVLALPLLAPRSYTGEDTVEFFCHGGRVVPHQVTAACRKAGAAAAPPGEFSRRAFLNGKLSLDQAEAVADLIHAPAELAAHAAIGQLMGGMDEQLRSIENPLLDLLAEIEGSLEFADEEEMAVPAEQARTILAASRDGITRLLDIAPAGRLLREGVHVVLAGEPNVGKSALFNALIEQDRAIVDAEAGTTRDVVTARVVRKGQAYVLHDTAGLRDEPGRIESKGIERTRATLAGADLVLSLRVAGGSSAGPDIPADAAPAIPVQTKCDLISGAPDPGPGLPTSSLSGDGLEDVWSAIEEVVAGFGLDDALSLGVVMNERHRHKLQECRDDLSLVIAELDRRDPGDEITGTMLGAILSGLGEVSGRVFSEQLLDSVFRRFCVGK